MHFKRPVKLPFVALALIQEHGPISCSKLGELMGVSREAARNHVRVLSEMSPKVVYIAGWTPHMGHGRAFSGPKWAAGDLPNAPTPQKALRKKPTAQDDERGYSEKRLKAEIMSKAKLIKPFRDEMLFLTAGRAP